MKKLKDITKEELELMSFDDIAYLILKEKGKKMKTVEIFGKIKEFEEDDDDEIEENVEESEIEEDDTLFIDETKEPDDDETEDDLKDLVVLDEENEGDL